MTTTDVDTPQTDGSNRRGGATPPAASTTDPDPTEDRLAAAAHLELLEAENRRLRTEYARVRQASHRKTALGLLAIGLVAVAGASVFPAVRDVLIALGATGVFGAVLTYYLSPGAFVAADVGERIYATLAANQAAIAGNLGLTDTRLYVPTGNPDRCRLFVPRYREPDLPDPDVDGPIVTDEASRGLVLEPTGLGLFSAFERALTADLARTPSALSDQLADALVEQFELAGSVDPTAEPAQVTVAITDSAVGDVDRFDHPLASFLAVGLAIGLAQPVALEVTPGDGRADWLVTCRWDLSDLESVSESESEASDEADDEDGDAATDVDDHEAENTVDDVTAPPR